MIINVLPQTYKGLNKVSQNNTVSFGTNHNATRAEITPRNKAQLSILMNPSSPELGLLLKNLYDNKNKLSHPALLPLPEALTLSPRGYYTSRAVSENIKTLLTLLKPADKITEEEISSLKSNPNACKKLLYTIVKLYQEDKLENPYKLESQHLYANTSDSSLSTQTAGILALTAATLGIAGWAAKEAFDNPAQPPTSMVFQQSPSRTSPPVISAPKAVPSPTQVIPQTTQQPIAPAPPKKTITQPLPPTGIPPKTPHRTFAIPMFSFGDVNKNGRIDPQELIGADTIDPLTGIKTARKEGEGLQVLKDLALSAEKITGVQSYDKKSDTVDLRKLKIAYEKSGKASLGMATSPDAPTLKPLPQKIKPVKIENQFNQ